MTRPRNTPVLAPPPAMPEPEAPGSQQDATEPPTATGIIPDPDMLIFDLDSPSLYLNRELTWLDFNRRVLHEAEDPRTPLLERVKFVAIVSANLDEFFMKRIGGLKQQDAAGFRNLTVDGRTPRQQIVECNALVRDLEASKERLLPGLLTLLAAAGITLAGVDDLSTTENDALREYYRRNIFPLLTPQSVDPAHPFPFISNLSLNLLVTVQHPQSADGSLARVKIPTGAGIPRFIKVGKRDCFVRLEEIICRNLDLLFPNMEVISCELFRVTRNANTEREEEQADDLLAMIESELRDRKFAPVVRIEVKQAMDPVRRGRLAAELELDETTDVFEVPGMMAMRDLFEIARLDYPQLKDPSHHPVDHPLLQTPRNIFHIIRDAGALLLQHPYESFSTSVERFLQEASADPKVRAIKMTLYRTAKESRIMDLLIEAADNGKQVAVVVELKARFDEATNIRLAERLEAAGIHVTYGVVGLKTHCKVIMVVRQDFNGLRRYLHLGTGNYHPDTARIYSDLGLFTCDDTLGEGATEQEAGLIRFKMNALEDADIVRALYRASQAGVQVELIVRDTCRLRPGVAGLSDHIRVISIVGRFLEHARIYYFRNGGAEEYFIGSADAMQRNLESQVEVLVPVEGPALQRELRRIFDTQLADRRNAWELRPDGSSEQLAPDVSGSSRGSHEQLIASAEERNREAMRLKRRTTQGFTRRNNW